MKTHKPTTKTGADLLGYKTYQNSNSYNDGLTRVATADGELAKNKPTFDPLAGKPTTKNTCIMSGRIPKADFEKVVLDSILQHGRPLGWQGPGLAKNVDDKVALTWDFSPVADGVVNAVNGTPSANDRPRRFHRLAVEHHSAWSLQHA
jgi:hypothetical protein